MAVCLPANCADDAIRNGLFTGRGLHHITDQPGPCRTDFGKCGCVHMCAGEEDTEIVARAFVGMFVRHRARSLRADGWEITRLNLNDPIDPTTTADKMCVAANAIARSTKNVTYK